MKVYIIQKGYYSDRHIVAVRETRKEAEELVEFLTRYLPNADEIEILEFDTQDCKTCPDDFEIYLVTVNERLDIVGLHRVPRYEEDEDKYHYSVWDLEYDINSADEFAYPVFYVYAIDEKHALKVASDKIAEHKYRMEVELERGRVYEKD